MNLMFSSPEVVSFLLCRCCCCCCLYWQTLCEAYVDPNVSDKSGAPFVRYVGLVEEIEGVFGVRELERKPECDVDASVKAAQVGVGHHKSERQWTWGLC